MTLKGLYAQCLNTSFGADQENLNEDRRRYSPMTLDSGNIRFMRIFAVVLKIYVNFSQIYVCLRPDIIQWYAILVFKFTSLVHNTSLPTWLSQYWSIGVTSGDVGSGVAECDPQNIWNPLKNCVSFVDATSWESQQIRPTLVFSITYSVILLSPFH